MCKWASAGKKGGRFKKSIRSGLYWTIAAKERTTALVDSNEEFNCIHEILIVFI
jgi:hypothetical protein